MKEIHIGKNEENQRLDKFLRKYMPKASLSFIYKMLRKKNIKVNGQKSESTYILQQGDILQVYFSDETLLGFQDEKSIPEVKRGFSIVYEDENILLVNKPSGLIIHGDKNEENNTLINQAIRYLYEEGSYDPTKEKTFIPASVNRLDRNTSGLVMIGKNYPTVQSLNEMLRDKDRVHKYYIALVAGNITGERVLKGYLKKDEDKNQVRLLNREEEGAKYIHTIIRSITATDKYSLVEVEIITGRSHQIRLHLASIGHPIIGDSKYGDGILNLKLKKEFGLTHQFLHAYKLHFNNPINHLEYLSEKTFLCHLPKELEKIKKALLI